MKEGGRVEGEREREKHRQAESQRDAGRKTDSGRERQRKRGRGREKSLKQDILHMFFHYNALKTCSKTNKVSIAMHFLKCQQGLFAQGANLTCVLLYSFP